MPVHNFVRLWCILLRNAAVQHPGKFARSCVGNTAAILHQHNMTGGDFLFQLDGKHIPRGQGVLGKILRHIPQPQPAFDQRHHLVGGSGLSIRLQNKIVA